MVAADSGGKQVKLICSKEVFVNIELHVRHGSALKLRNVKWLVTDQRVSEPLLERPVLDALRLNTRELLATAADRFAGSADAKQLVGSIDGHSAGRVSCVMEGVFHADGDEKVEEIDADREEWYEIGHESDTEWEEMLSKKIKEAEDNGISTNGRQILEKLLRQQQENVRIRYNGGTAAQFRPLALRINPKVHPVRVKPRRYPPEKRRFLRKYVFQLQKLGLVKIAERTEWVSAPLIVPKKPPTLYRMTVNYQPINATIVKNTWPMSHIDAVLQDMRGAKTFSAIDFTSGYWQLQLHKSSQHLHAFMTPDGVMQPTRTTQGGCNGAANFQAWVEPCFSELRDNLLAWLDDFALSTSLKKDCYQF